MSLKAKTEGFFGLTGNPQRANWTKTETAI